MTTEFHSADVEAVIARGLAGADAGDLPASVLEQAKRLVTDTIGVAWAGTGSEIHRALRRDVLPESGSPRASLWGWDGRTSVEAATFLNGVAAATLEFDSLHPDATTHAEIVVVPAAMALAEHHCLGGSDFLAAVVLGSDLAVRLALAAPRDRGWFATSVSGVIGAAGAAARLLRLDEATTTHALGLAMCHAFGSAQSAFERSGAKAVLSASASVTGLRCALMAKAGVTGPGRWLEGEAGYFALFGRDGAHRLTEGLGSTFGVLGTGLKKYPSCGANHTAVEALLRLRARHGLRADSVESIAVDISPYMNALVGSPYRPDADPRVAAQFSIRYGLAAALVRGRFGLDDIEPAAARDPTVLALVERVEVVVGQDRTDLLGPARVEVRLKDGQVLVQTVEAQPGSPDAPLSEGELATKFDDCVSRGDRPLGPARARALRERISAIEAVDDMSSLFAAI